MSYKHFSNKQCEYYPCHNLQDQNCLFCFCPLYFFDDCGGNPKLTNGIRDCSSCVKNHDEQSYDFVINKLKEYFSKNRIS
ncbi:MAG: cysteine-rich small domain-containing protein [Calditerrivibrio sp.]|nr:cysteine-rich small domain-containing protein [Calditerrivibrio sp.]